MAVIKGISVNGVHYDLSSMLGDLTVTTDKTLTHEGTPADAAATGRHPVEPDDGLAYLGLLFPAIQSTGSNLSSIHCAMVLPFVVVHLC